MLKKFLITFFKKILYSLISGNNFFRLPCLSNIYKFFYKIFVKSKGVILIDVQGNKIYTDCRDEGITPFLLTQRVYEEYETYIFKEMIKPGMNVVDIGANIGYYSLIAAKLVGDSGTVFSFEPDPKNYELLIKNIEINRYKNIIPIPKAVSNRKEKVQLFIDKNNYGNPSFSKNNIGAFSGFIEVETTTLDDYFRKISYGNSHKNFNIDFIKLDTQGAEGLAIEGGEKILKNNNLIIMMEFWPYGLKNIGTNPVNLLNKLEELDFDIFMIEKSSHSIYRVEISEVLNIFEYEKNCKGCIYLFFKRQIY